MSFASPLGLWLLALALPIAALYWLKVKRRPVVVPYLRLWQDLLVETRARSLFERLRRLLSLLLQLLILASIGLALADPAFELASVKRESIVVLLDASASMQAAEEVDGDRWTRFEMALEKAREIVEGRSFEDELMLAVASDRVEVLAPFTRSTLRLRDALEKAKPTERSLDADRALAFAREVVAGKDDPVVLFLSDGDAGRIEPKLSSVKNARLLPVGEAVSNLAITSFATRKNEAQGTDYVLAEVVNHGLVARECRLELSLEGSVRKVITRTIDAGATIHEELQLSLPEGGILRLVVSTAPAGAAGGAPADVGAQGSASADLEPEEDALALDDEAFAIVRPTRLRRVLVVTETEPEAGPFWIALQSMSEWIHEGSRSVTLDQYPALSAEDKAADVTICLNVVPKDLDARTNLVLLHTELPVGLPAKLADESATPKVFDWEREHELNRYLNWRDLPLPPARALDLTSGVALVSSFEGPIVAAFDLGTRRAIYVGFDMTAELFPFRLAFPLLLRNALSWFEVEESEWFEPSYRVGAVVAPAKPLPAGARVTVDRMVGGETRTEDVPVIGSTFTYRGTESAGPLVFQIGDEIRATCVNLFDAKESDVAPAKVAEDARPLAEEGRHLLNRELWVLLALLGLAAWATEWALYHRRITE